MTIKNAHFSSGIHLWIVIILLIPTISPFIQMHGFRPIMFGLNILFFCYFIKFYHLERKIFQNSLILTYAILVFYHCANCYLQRVPMTSGNGYLAFFIPVISNFCVMVTIYILFLNNPQKTLYILCVGYILYMILAYMSVSEVEGRLIGQYIHPNQYAQAAGMGLFLIIISKSLKYIGVSQMCLMMVLPVAAIFACGSRNGLGLLFFVIVTLIISRVLNRHVSITNYIVLVVVIILLGYIGKYIIDSSFVGNRLLTHETSDKFQVHTGTVIDVLGDRAIYYVLGFQNFLTNPIFGIGLWHFNTFNNFGYTLHSEYMIHLCEGGLIGFSLYIFFVCILFYKLFVIFWLNKRTYHFSVLMTFVSYLFIGLTAREFYYTQFFPILGICLAYSKMGGVINNKKMMIQSISKYKNRG